MNHRKIQALRNLAERPGTEAEGRVAREMLKRLEAKNGPPISDLEAEAWVWQQFGDFLRTGSLDDLARATGYHTCDCGSLYPPFTKCSADDVHAEINAAIRKHFTKGRRVYYNAWAYPKNCPATVVGYSKDWNWVRLKFDHLKNVRSVPAYRKGLWYVSLEPESDETLHATGVRGGMENIDDICERVKQKYKATASSVQS